MLTLFQINLQHVGCLPMSAVPVTGQARGPEFCIQSQLNSSGSPGISASRPRWRRSAASARLGLLTVGSAKFTVCLNSRLSSEFPGGLWTQLSCGVRLLLISHDCMSPPGLFRVRAPAPLPWWPGRVSRSLSPPHSPARGPTPQRQSRSPGNSRGPPSLASLRNSTASWSDSGGARAPGCPTPALRGPRGKS